MPWTWGQLTKWRRRVALRSPQAWRPVKMKPPPMCSLSPAESDEVLLKWRLADCSEQTLGPHLQGRFTSGVWSAAASAGPDVQLCTWRSSKKGPWQSVTRCGDTVLSPVEQLGAPLSAVLKHWASEAGWWSEADIDIHCLFLHGPPVGACLSLSSSLLFSCSMKSSHEAFGLTQPTTW